MRKIIAITQVALDGVMQAPGGPEEDPSNGFTHGAWAMPPSDEANSMIWAQSGIEASLETFVKSLACRMGVAPFRVMAVGLMLAGLVSVSSAHAQDPSPLERVEALGLDTVRVGRVTAYFAPADREHAERLAALSEEAAAYFERELGASFALRLAVLTPEYWFTPHAGGDLEPYGIPWAWVEDLLMGAPASLDEGVLISGPTDHANVQRVRFVLLHEYGHLANKRYLHPDSPRPYSSIWWFEELLATYFAYAFVRAHDPEWAETSRREWVDFVEGYTPAVLSLDWGFMYDLPPDEFARTYAWYQNLLNLRAAALYQEHGLDFLREVRDQLAWGESEEWTTESLLLSVEEIAPGFRAWADSLPKGNYLPSDND